MPHPVQDVFDPLAISKRIRSRYLLPGERVVVSTRRHWFRLAMPVTMVVLTFVLMVAGALSPAWGEAAWLLVWLWLAACGYALWRILEWRTEWFIATDRRLLKTYGLITQRVAMMPLAKVTDMSYDRSLLGRMLGYGEFVMESAGQDQALSKMDLMPDPEPKYVAMCETIFGRDVSDPTEDGEHWGARDGHGDRWDRDGWDRDESGDEHWDEEERGEEVRDQHRDQDRGQHRDQDRRRQDGTGRSRGSRGPDPHPRPRGRRRLGWEPVDRRELPDDWDWVDEEPTRQGERTAVGRRPGRERTPRRRPVAIDPDPTPWR